MYAEWKGFTRSVKESRTREVSRLPSIRVLLETNSSVNVHTRNSWMKLARPLPRFFSWAFFPCADIREREIYPFLGCGNNRSDDAGDRISFILENWGARRGTPSLTRCNSNLKGALIFLSNFFFFLRKPRLSKDPSYTEKKLFRVSRFITATGGTLFRSARFYAVSPLSSQLVNAISIVQKIPSCSARLPLAKIA